MQVARCRLIPSAAAAATSADCRVAARHGVGGGGAKGGTEGRRTQHQQHVPAKILAATCSRTAARAVGLVYVSKIKISMAMCLY